MAVSASAVKLAPPSNKIRHYVKLKHKTESACHEVTECPQSLLASQQHHKTVQNLLRKTAYSSSLSEFELGLLHNHRLKQSESPQPTSPGKLDKEALPLTVSVPITKNLFQPPEADDNFPVSPSGLDSKLQQGERKMSAGLRPVIQQHSTGTEKMLMSRTQTSFSQALTRQQELKVVLMNKKTEPLVVSQESIPAPKMLITKPVYKPVQPPKKSVESAQPKQIQRTKHKSPIRMVKRKLKRKSLKK